MAVDIINRALLEVISVRLATSHESIREHFQKSLLRYTHGTEHIDRLLETGLKEVTELEFVVKDGHGSYSATQLGKAVVASALDPDDGVFIYEELSRALKAFVMDGDMHILYTFTPVQDFAATVNWQVFRDEMGSLDDSGFRVLRILGIQPATIIRLQVIPTFHQFTLSLDLEVIGFCF
jgi:DNA polymerase theta